MPLISGPNTGVSVCVTNQKFIGIRRVCVLTRIIRCFPEERALLARDVFHIPKEKPDKTAPLLDCGYTLKIKLGKKGLFSSHSKLVKPRRDTPLDLGK